MEKIVYVNYKETVIEVVGERYTIMDAFTGDLLDEGTENNLTTSSIVEKAKTTIDGFLPEERLKENVRNGFAYVRYLS